tara:strand:- start:2730 stop:3623 length:894 start_codon:yes stop_codon:yes gene_type:complete
MKTLIIGSSGFVGTSLKKMLEDNQRDIIGTYFKNGNDKENTFFLDLKDFNSVSKLISKIKPDEIINLSGSMNKNFFDEILSTNIISSINLYESLLKNKINPKLISVSSSAQYGIQNHKNLVRESDPRNPVNIYGISKMAQEKISNLYHQKGLNIVTIVPFNLIGPGISANLLPGRIIQQFREILSRKKKKLVLGNYSTVRDYLDVDDFSRGLILTLDKGISGESYNLCSGIATEIRSMIELFKKSLKLESPVKFTENVSTDIDLPYQVGDNKKIYELCGWTPMIKLEDSIDRMVKEL